MDVRPNKEEFLALARDHDVVPVVRELTSDTVTPFTVYSRLARGGRNPFLFESVEGGERVARYSFAGVDPFRIVELRETAWCWSTERPSRDRPSMCCAG